MQSAYLKFNKNAEKVRKTDEDSKNSLFSAFFVRITIPFLWISGFGLTSGLPCDRMKTLKCAVATGSLK